MGLFVKICGLASEEDVQAVAALKPDALGFVFWDGSPRFVAPENVAKWTASIPAAIRKVGVFVDATPDYVAQTAASAGVDVVQLHGAENPELYRRGAATLWKALHLDRVDVSQVESYNVDAFLVDSYSAQSPGGTGKTCDWNLVRSFVETHATPVILAGGLTPANVATAIAEAAPWGVDVSSGVETRPGVKDIDEVRAFIEICRSA